MVKTVRLGKSDVFVHPIGLGTNAVGGHNLYPGVLNEEEGKQVVRTAIEHGMTMLDTAYFYGMGRSEELVGEVINEYKREEVAVATKGSQKSVNGDFENDNSPNFLRKCVEDSLRRLKTDYIDLFYIHYPDEKTPKDEAVGALKKLKEEGKIRSIGISNFSYTQLKEANKDGYVDVVQSEYNLLHREAEKDLIPYTQENKITFIPYFPLESGLLAGNYDVNSEFSDNIRSQKPAFQGDTFRKNLEKVERVRTIAKEKGVGVAHIILAWYLTIDSIDALIPGAKRESQVIDNLKTLNIQLSDKEKQNIDQIFS